MMFLLVFFVLISINVIPAAGLSTLLPSSSAANQATPDKPIIITLTKDQRLQVNGQDCALSELANHVHQAAKGAKDPQVTLRSDAETNMQQVVDVMDVLRQAAIVRVSIATRMRSTN